MSIESIKVAVRVRPFNSRELLKGEKLIVHMKNDGKTTLVTNAENNRKHNFIFDHSLWSHDGYIKTEDGRLTADSNDSLYIDQDTIFDKLGLPLLNASLEGYNSSLFAYGQTGSGKSYSIMGDDKNQGLVPRICGRLFSSLEQKKNSQQKIIRAEVKISMLEIYNEKIHDLLTTTKSNLTMRENASKGFHVQGLKSIVVWNERDVLNKIKEGEKQRTIASTKMNDHSSRAHTIVTLQIAQDKGKLTTLSTINLVDLAGSERAKQTDSTGERFEEAKSINKSLLTLGNCIAALCKQASSNKSQHIPYRESILTALLKNALGGNSKTVMLAAISPHIENYEQTMSTLYYADRAKAIKNRAEINQTNTDKLLKEILREKEDLLKELNDLRLGKSSAFTDEELERMKKEQEDEIREYKDRMTNMEKAYKEKLALAESEMRNMADKQRQADLELTQYSHLININEDPALTGKVIHVLKNGQTSLVGNNRQEENNAKRKANIIMNGPGIAVQHAELECFSSGEVRLKTLDGLVKCNGKEISSSSGHDLRHFDRLMFGTTNLFILIDPKKHKKNEEMITWEDAQAEIAKIGGFQYVSDDDALLQQEAIALYKAVADANTMAEELGVSVNLKLILVAPELLACPIDQSSKSELCVRGEDCETEQIYLWNKREFLNRQASMQTAYEEWESNAEPIPENENPWFDNKPQLVGIGNVPLQYLAHLFDFTDEEIVLLDFNGTQSGFLRVEILINTKCDSLDDPIDLLGKNIEFTVHIDRALTLPKRFTKTFCKFTFYNQEKTYETDSISGQNPIYNFSTKLKMDKIDRPLVRYLSEAAMSIQVWGEQASTASRRMAADSGIVKQLKLKLENIKRVIDKSKSNSSEIEEIRRILNSYS